MWPATAFSVAHRSIQEDLQICNLLQLISAVNVSVETNLNQDCLIELLTLDTFYPHKSNYKKTFYVCTAIVLFIYFTIKL